MTSREEPATDDEEENPSETTKPTKATTIPEKSKELYLTAYNQFITWQKTKQTESMDERTISTYFKEISKEKAPSTIWSVYFMLKKTLRVKHNIDLGQYSDLADLVKLITSGSSTRKAKVLSIQQVDKFLNDAPDVQHLATKVALIFVVHGACRREDLCNITIQDIRDYGSFYDIKRPQAKSSKRHLLIEGKLYDIVKKYANLRPKNVPTDRFFLNYQSGKCTKQVIGINKFGRMPKKIAEFLKLPEPELYTGHCFRRTSTTVLADSRADLATLNHDGEWKSDQIAEGYVEDSLDNRRRIGRRISESILKPSTANHPNVKSTSSKRPKNRDAVSVAGINTQKLAVADNENSSSTTEFPFEDNLRMTNC